VLQKNHPKLSQPDKKHTQTSKMSKAAYVA
jgi:hypothetical protein